jgi:Rrf2 family iron-sulfur cluster assembly transcriptional regulator
LSYLEQLFAALRGKGLVRGVRGPGGGYYLGRPAAEISIADIICAVDEWAEITRNRAQSRQGDTRQSATHALWDRLSDDMFDFLSDISVADLISEHRPRPLEMRGTRRAA